MAALRTCTKKLQPVFTDLVTGARFNPGKQGVEIIPLEENGTAAIRAYEIMLVTVGSGHEHVAAILAVHALDQPQLLQAVEGAVHRHQAYAGVDRAAEGVHLKRLQGMLAVGKHSNDHTPLAGNSAAVLL